MSFSWFKKIFSGQQKSFFLIGLGLLFLFVAFFLKGYQISRQNSFSFSDVPKLVEIIKEEDLPERIIIPKVGIDLPVFPAEIIDNHWMVADKGASYLVGTGVPGQEGNTVIYGHSKNSLLGPIRWLEREAEIKVVNGKNEEFIYKVEETKTVSPEAVEVLSPTQEATLTLYTCIGFLDQERFIVVAKLQPE